MINQKIAKIFKNLSIILELENDSRFRIIAYEKAADIISNLTQDLKDVYKTGGLKALQEIPGVGQNIALKIEEFIKTKKIKSYQKLLKKYPETMLALTEVPGIGAKVAYKLYKELGITNITKLEKAAKAGLIQKLPHFKEKSEHNILRGINQYRVRTKERNRLLLKTGQRVAQEIITYLTKDPSVKKIDTVGSLRRMKETVGDIDLVMATNQSKKVFDNLKRAEFVKTVLSQGQTKMSFIHNLQIRVDIEVLAQKDYGSLLHHLTGSKEHNVRLRTWASEKGLKISEYGITKNKKLYHFADEKSFFKFLKMDYIEPELREDRGEIEAAREKKLPNLVKYTDLQGDLHCHTEHSDGSNTIEEIIIKAKKLKYKYVGIADHTVGLGVASGLDDQDLLKHYKNIQKISQKLNFKALVGAEINITATGQLDLKPSTIKNLDFSIGSVHSAFNQPKEVMTKRVLTAINSGINILGHPSGRLLGKRPGYQLDWPEIFKVCAKNKVAIEINSSPERLDLNDLLVKQALSYGCNFVINSDAHKLEHLEQVQYGLATARRGWATKKDIINTYTLARLLAWFK